jgi:hypothetical protein
MRTPGFSAEASIYRSSSQYRAHTRHTSSEAGTIEPAMFYGPIEDLGCVLTWMGERKGKRAILWDIPFGMSWWEACGFFEHPIYGKADECHERDWHMYGYWYFERCNVPPPPPPPPPPPSPCYRECYERCRRMGRDPVLCYEICEEQCRD